MPEPELEGFVVGRLTAHLNRCAVETPYIKKMGRSFEIKDLIYFMISHASEVEDFDEWVTISMYDGELVGYFLDFALSSLNRVENDTSDGEYYYESHLMSNAIQATKVLKAMGVGYPLRAIKSEIEYKKKKGDFSQVKDLLESLEALIKNLP